MSTDDIDDRIRHTITDLRRIIDQYEAEMFRDESPFRAHLMPDRIKLRLRLLADQYEERADIRRSMRRPPGGCRPAWKLASPPPHRTS